MAKVCNNTKMSAPMKEPIGCFMPPSTAITRMLMSQEVPTDPGTISPLYQTSNTPETAAISEEIA